MYEYNSILSPRKAGPASTLVGRLQKQNNAVAIINNENASDFYQSKLEIVPSDDIVNGNIVDSG